MSASPAKLLTGAALAIVLAASPVMAQQDLEERVRELEQQLELMKRQLEAQVKQAQETAAKAAEKSGSDVIVKMKGPAPSFESADGKYTMAFTGRAHWDFAWYNQDDNAQQVNGVVTNPTTVNDLNSGSNLRRARLGVKGKIDGDWRYELVLDAGDSNSGDVQIDQIWLGYNGIKPLKLKIGRHKTPNGFDELTSSNDIPFIERSSTNNAALGPAGGKRVGFSGVANGDFWWAGAGIFGSDWDETFDDEQFSANARVAFAPIRSGKDYALHIGGSGYHIFEPGQGNNNATRSRIRFRDRPNIRVDGNRWIDATTNNGDSAYMVGLEAAAQWRNFWMNGEYNWFGYEESFNPSLADNQRGDQDFYGYYVQAGWVITGEPRPYSMSKAAWSGVKPKNPFKLGGDGWGALETAFRYDFVDLNDQENSFAADGTFLGTRGGEQETFTFAVNWWINNYVAIKFNYIHVDVDLIGNNNDCSTGLNCPSAGDSFDVFAIRTQFKF